MARTSTGPVFIVQPAADRGIADHGWLQTAHSFSFADYHDPAYVHWGALRVFNDDRIAPDTGFGTHPHRDMEILTYVLEGELEHRDSMGNRGVVRSGGVQYLSAGTGIAHSEVNASREHPLHLVQMWVVPRAAGLAPRYGQIDFADGERDGRWLLVASGRDGASAPIAIHQDATLHVARLREQALPLRVEGDRFAFLFVARGTATLDDGRVLGAGDAVRIAGPLDRTIAGDAELVLWDTPPLDVR